MTCEDEIAKCTNRVADALTVVREQEGTTASPHEAGKKVRLHITAAIIQQLQDHDPLDTGVHGVGASKVASEAVVDSKISTHTTPSAHHTAITPAQVDGKITTHKNIPDAHHSKPTFTECYSDHLYPTTAWAEWDLSAIVPAGSTAVLVGLGNYNAAGTVHTAGVRKHGSEIERTFWVPGVTTITGRMPITFIVVECAASRKIEIKGATATYARILGYWT